MHLTLAEREMARGRPSGCATWLSFGLTIEEQQLVFGPMKSLTPTDVVDTGSNSKGLYESLVVTPQPSRKFSWNKRDPGCVRRLSSSITRQQLMSIRYIYCGRRKYPTSKNGTIWKTWTPIQISLCLLQRYRTFLKWKNRSPPKITRFPYPPHWAVLYVTPVFHMRWRLVR